MSPRTWCDSGVFEQEQSEIRATRTGIESLFVHDLRLALITHTHEVSHVTKYPRLSRFSPFLCLCVGEPGNEASNWLYCWTSSETYYF